MNNQTIAIGVVALVLGLVVGIAGTSSWLAPSKPETGHGHGHEDDHKDEFERGPHGGRMLESDGLELEVTIYESGIPPQFRIYAYEDGKPIALDGNDLTIYLHRLGGRVDEFSFKQEGEYLRGEQVVEEPHSFDVDVMADKGGESYAWHYASYETRVDLSAQAAEQAGIIVQEAGEQRITQTITLRGEIVLNADTVAHIVPRVHGIVRQVNKRLGDHVDADEVMAVLESRELVEAKSDDIAAEQRLELAAANFARAEALKAKGISSEEDFLKAKQQLAEAEIEHRKTEARLHAFGLTQEQVENVSKEPDTQFAIYTLRAPFAGTVIEKHITQGELVDEDSDVYVLADLSTVWVDLTVYQRDASKIRPGQPVTVSFRGEIPDAVGVIDYISPVVDQATRTATARVILDNPDGLLRPGLFVTAELVEHEAAVPVAVTREAIQNIRGWSAVFVRYGNTFEARPLELGHRDSQWVEVLSGLSAGEQYVAKNSFVLKAEIGKSGATHAH
ncbi:MAG: efflux RND transporter periplasmic adaptor subunit [Planctomycetes bacterium]|nr:efflux RND transporter periplasmic adaptor subunit [Planctomycetota bacterium]